MCAAMARSWARGHPSDAMRARRRLQRYRRRKTAMNDDPYVGTFDETIDKPKGDAGAQARAGDGRKATGICREDFVAYMPQHNYIFVPTREPWPAASVDARLKPTPLLDATGNPIKDDKGKPKFIAASTWLDQNRPVEQITWAPGEPLLIKDRVIAEGGW